MILQLVVEFTCCCRHTQNNRSTIGLKLEKMESRQFFGEKYGHAWFSKANKNLPAKIPTVSRNPIVELQARLHALGQPNLNPMASKGTKAKKKNEKKIKASHERSRVT